MGGTMRRKSERRDAREAATAARVAMILGPAIRGKGWIEDILSNLYEGVATIDVFGIAFSDQVSYRVLSSQAIEKFSERSLIGTSLIETHPNVFGDGNADVVTGSASNRGLADYYRFVIHPTDGSTSAEWIEEIAKKVRPFSGAGPYEGFSVQEVYRSGQSGLPNV